MIRYTAVFEFEGLPPAVNKNDGWKGGKLCALSFKDDLEELEDLRAFVEELSQFNGMMLNGNHIAERASELIRKH